MNIIFCGLPMSGKTTIGKLLAEKINQEFIDIDQLIEKSFESQFGKHYSCRHIYEERGEFFFRMIEKQQIFALKNCSKKIIALGGGTLDDEDNRVLLQTIGTIIYLDTPINILLDRFATRPLPYLDSYTPEIKLRMQEQLRVPLFKNISTIILSTESPIEEILNTLLKIFHHGK